MVTANTLTRSPLTRSPLTRSQLRDEVATHIRELILAGRAVPGSLLRLDPLAEELGISITPVREALILLARDGWVSQEPNRGFRVARIGRGDVQDAYFVHAVCAGELSARSALVITPNELEGIRGWAEHMYSLYDGDPALVEELNHELHSRIYAPAQSPRLLWFVAAATRYVPRRYWWTIPGWLDMNRVEHDAIIQALSARDVEAARSTMAEHIQHAGELLVNHLDEMGFFAETGDSP